MTTTPTFNTPMSKAWAEYFDMSDNHGLSIRTIEEIARKHVACPKHLVQMTLAFSRQRYSHNA